MHRLRAVRRRVPGPLHLIYVRRADNPADAPVLTGRTRYGFVYEI